MPLLDDGQRVGDWTVVRYIDAGGNGEVFEVVDGAGRAAALKMLADRRAESVAYKRFRREVETVRALGERPGVLPILDAHLPEEPSRRDRAWYVMPLARPLADAVEACSVHDVVSVIATLAEVLAALHNEGIGHRDIKPANLLWHQDGPALGDFGLVHVPDAESLTEPDRVPGAFGYIADEVMIAPDTARAEPADVFALAKVLWKLLTPGAAFPPQGALSPDDNPSALQRSLTVAKADALDRILAAATRHFSTRIDMADLARQLRTWLALPAPAASPEGLDAVLDAARESMLRSRALADEGAARRSSTEAVQGVLVRQADALFEALRPIDPAGIQIGRMAVGPLNRLIEQPAEMGRPLYGQPFHYGARITRSEGMGHDDVLVVAFCLQVADEGPAEGVVTGLLLAGDETTNDSDFRPLMTRRAALGVELEAAVDETVREAAAHLSAVVAAFAARARPV